MESYNCSKQELIRNLIDNLNERNKDNPERISYYFIEVKSSSSHSHYSLLEKFYNLSNQLGILAFSSYKTKNINFITSFNKYFDLLKQSEAKDSKADNELGHCFEKGIYVTPDADEAFNYYYKSASKGNNSAQYNLGFCYTNGIGTSQDFKEAF